MPKEIWVVKDTNTNLYLLSYSIDWESCGWTNLPLAALHFDTQAEADAIIDSWEDAPEGRFIGQNPPLH